MAITSGDTTRLIIELETILKGLRGTLSGLDQTKRRLESLARVERQLNTLGGAALRVGGGLRSLGATAAVTLTGPLAALGALAARSAADIDAIRNRLIATEGSLEAANRRLEQLRRLADESVGVTRRTALDTFAILATLGEITEETINKQIRSFGRLNAAFTIDDQQLFFRNLLQIFQQGFEVKDIKEALGRVPIFNQLLESAFGTADPERLRQLKAAGKLTLDTFLAGIATAVETDPVLGRIQESIRVRFEKTFERLRDSLEPLGRAILGPLERIVTAVEPVILRIAAAFERLPPGVQTAIVVVGLLTAALGPVLFLLGGIVSGLGALATALSALLPILGTIGLPALLAILGGLAVTITNVIVAVTALGLAWRSNFLGIRQVVANAANAVVAAFNRIRAVFEDAARRILPTLQSITTKVLSAVTAVWERYGATVVRVVGDAFRFVTDVTETFLRLFTDFVDLVLKLIDGDWRGAWRAFARIIIAQLDRVGPLFNRFNQALRRVMLSLTAFIVRQAIVFAQAGSLLAARFIGALAIQLIAGAPQLTNALALMLVIAASGVAMGPIAQALVARLVAELRKAVAEGLPALVTEEQVKGETTVPRRRRDIAGAGIFRKKQPGGDEKGENILRRQLDKLREAQDALAEAREEAQLAQLRSRIETEFEATKAGLDRELTTLEANFDERLVALRSYLQQRKDLQESQVDAEIVKELELTSVLFSELAARRRAAEREFQTELREIEQDPKLKGRARDAAIETSQLKRATELEKALSEFKIKHAEATAQVVELEKQRKASVEALLRLERELTRQIELQKAELRFDLLEQQGLTADAETGRLKARFTETLRDLRIDITELGADLQDALNKVNLAALQQRLDELPEPVRVMVELLDIGVKRAQIAEAQQLVDSLSAGLRLDEERIQARVLDGLLNQRQAQAAILLIQQQYRGVLLDVLQGELAKAKLIKDQGLIVSIQAQIDEVQRLGIEIDEVGQQINQTLFRDLQSGLSGIFSGARKGFEGLRDAAISFGERLLDTLNDLAATSILQQIEDIFKPDATDTRGTVGGFLARLFGLGPDKSQAAATAAATTLQTGATVAAATLTTGTTAASASFATSVVTSAASFASAVIAAGAAFTVAVGAAGIAQGASGGLGSLLGGTAATGLYASVRGGAVHVLEGGYPEAILTTDPRHFSRQMEILRTYLHETRGLGGRIRGFAAGAFVTPDLMAGIPHAPMPSLDVGSLSVSSPISTMRLRQILVDERDVGNWVNSPEGERVMVDFLHRNQPVIRKLSGK